MLQLLDSPVEPRETCALTDHLPTLIVTFLAILSGAGLALAWFLVAPPLIGQLATSRLGHAVRSRGALALLLILPFAATVAALAVKGDRLRPSVAAVPASQTTPLDQARKEAPHDLEAAVKQLEARLAKDPNDQDGWRLLERSYTELGDTEKAADAARRAAALGAATGDAEAQSAHGEDLVTAAGGMVGPDARRAFQAALAADPTDPRARFFLGLAAAQDGHTDEAIQRWLMLERDSPPDAPWLDGLRANLGRLAQQAGISVDDLARRRDAVAATSATPAQPQAPVPGPTAADMAAAAQMAPDDRAAMIREMVQRLADRQQQNPKDVDGWLRLGRAYSVLGDQQKSLDAFRRASEADPAREDARQAYANARTATGQGQ
jgi:cytochrome c-type biogenesis protein CcmH